jgi:enamine deaminase RidA (YjgF/YER057c/UK114 family)
MLKADFEAQTRQAFANIAATLARAGASLADIVSMTVYIGDTRHGDRFVQIRKEYFPDGYPASTLVTVTGFARPEMMVEITPVAVVGA